MSSQFELSTPPTDAISAVKFAPGASNRMLVSSWDRNVYLYDTSVKPDGQLLRKYEHRAPVLDVCWGADENEAFSAGLDWDVRRINLETGEQSVLSSHEAGVKSVVYSRETSTVISASWDSTLHVHHPTKMPHVPATINLPSKPFSLSITPTKLVVAMASRALHIYDIRSLALLTSQASEAPPNVVDLEPLQRRESSLKFMTRAVACMPKDDGYASSSIEGRIAVEWFDPSPDSQARKYAFKCHRQVAENGVDVVYPVNALAFHPVHGTFASGGGDGFVALWDGVAKRRIRQYQRYPSSIAALAFSDDGKYLAVAVSPGFEDGKDDISEGVVKVFVRELSESEAKAKGAK
ncbi:putative nuclear pore complex subunit [Xylona heveae TC161]|uniref:Putative nuclear pore complex subunit n=1 Tax=Xylona heveae (strain CBS 132557 / TC161) TaxID=1328760 RepID=A0A164ZQC5_XYLHT|nr:putative nuclear pore complex subunit [Xylona heveae TC161]KZF19372.1 putative nuclear pore complex subunit [Xylona heveae TC161]